ncbi:hypothetical protein PENSPDRAFT_679560 [Peniophora sp. CONT]|nr:hypothetical protein PENSPDRAFT_679560 [Peniophora sp. CONT]
MLFSTFIGHRFALLFFGAWLSAAAAQTLEIPPTWMQTTSNSSREVRVDLAYGAASALLDQVDPSVGVVPGIPTVQYLSNVFSVLAIQDYQTRNNSWVSTVPKGMQDYYTSHGVYGDPPGRSGDANYWALAFYYAFRAYKQDFLLVTAKEIYANTSATCFIAPSAAANGTGAGRNVSFTPPSGCANGDFAGGVFVTNAVLNDLEVCGECVGPFMTLSAYLYEETNDTAYYEAAQLSADFMIRNMWTGSFVVDGFILSTCSAHQKPLTLNQAGFIEGLSVLANVTNNGTLTAFLRDVVSNVTTYPAWSSAGGIIREDSNLSDWGYNMKGLFIRGLAEARVRNPGTDLARYIEAYIMVQFNGVLDNARGQAPNNNYYASSWSTGEHATRVYFLRTVLPSSSA